MFAKLMSVASRLLLAGALAAVVTGATGCDELLVGGGEVVYYDDSSGWYDDSQDYSAADQISTFAGNFIDYGDGVPWVAN